MPDLASLIVFPLLLLFARLGTAIMIFPGFSDPAITARARLLFALSASVVLLPLVAPRMPPLPDSTAILLALVLGEVLTGILIAIGARLFMTTLAVAGDMISFTTGFQAATLFDPASASTTTAISLFLLLVGGMLIFAFDIHHLLIHGVVESYQLIPAGQWPDAGDALSAVLTLITDVFIIGIKLAAPVIAVGLLINIAFGIFGRLIPQLQVFFLAIPISIVLGLGILALGLGGLVATFGESMAERAILLGGS